MSKLQEVINDEVLEELEALKDATLGTEESEKTINGISKLVDKSIELSKAEAEAELKKQELELKKQQAEEEKKDRKIKNILTGAGIVIPTGVTVWGVLKSFKFEETGTVTTILGRGLIQKLLPKK